MRGERRGRKRRGKHRKDDKEAVKLREDKGEQGVVEYIVGRGGVCEGGVW